MGAGTVSVARATSCPGPGGFVGSVPGDGGGRGQLSGPGQSGEGFAAVQLQSPPSLGEALGRVPVGEDHRERDVVEAGPIRRAVGVAGQAGVLAEDAVSLAMVQVLDRPVAVVEPEQVLRRRGPGIERGDDVRGVDVARVPGPVTAPSAAARGSAGRERSG